MPVPFKVKAVYEYKSEEPDDLTFENGQIITVIEDDDPDWYTGEYTSSDGQKSEGIFPRNFVEKYEPAVPSRPVRAARKAPEPEPEPQHEQEREDEPSVVAHKPPTQPPAATHEPAKEAEVEPPKEFSQPVQVSAAAPPPAPRAEESEVKAAKKPPPVVEKPSSFRDRIAAFNKPAAAPVAPFKPSGAGTGFIKKPFVAPPPSRNAYVPPPREPPPQKVYRREEEESRPEVDQPTLSERSAPAEEEDQPKTETLKERIARLQQQQLESAQRQADASKKKEKPKKPKPTAEADDAEGEALERVSTERTQIEPEPRGSLDETTAPTPPMPSRELVSDTNDADDSGAADTEDAQESTEEERPRPKSIASPPVKAETQEADDEDDTEEEEDPEVRRKRELRERMAKMSGGMGMMGMFGAGAAPSAASKKPKVAREEKEEPAYEEEAVRAPPVPIMALPGMAQSRPTRQESDGDDSAQPTPLAEHEDDYISQKPSRTSTDRSQPLSPRDRAPPPVPQDIPQPPQSPGARPIPPPPPPTRHVTTMGESEDGSAPVPPPILTRAVPPQPPATQSPHTPDASRAIPPIPMSPTSPQTRAAPPLPPAPSRKSTEASFPVDREDDDAEVTEYDGDYDTDIAADAKHKAALKSHNRESSFEEAGLSDDAESLPVRTAPPPIPQMREAPPPVPQAREAPPPPPTRDLPPPLPRESVDMPRAMPPPVPSSMPSAPPPLPPMREAPPPAPRESVDTPRFAPPPVPLQKSPDDDYDPYNYSNQAGIPGMVAAMRAPTQEFDEYEARDQVHAVPERSAPPPPTIQEPDPISMSGGLAAPPKRSVDLGRSNSRRSADVARPSLDQAFIAADIDLAQSSLWWTKENTPPPALQNRSDVLWEVESSTQQKRGGRSSVSRDVYILYQDYSQSTINATFDASEPTHVSFEQSHERPPMPPRKDQLESASETFGVSIAKAAEKATGNTIGEGSPTEFVTSLIRPLTSALLPIGTRSYGALVYANLANASTQQFDEIRPGDIITFRNAKFAGHKGGLHQKYSQDLGQFHVGVVIDWDGTKKKIRAWEQRSDGKKAKVRDESYRVADLKSGEVGVWRVMPRAWVNWGTS